MKVQTKSILILLVTLIIGIIMGTVGSGMLRDSVIRSRMSDLRSPQRFSRMMERIIQPTPEQQKQLREKFDQQHERVFELSEKFRVQMDSLNTEFEHELKDILTREQLDRLSEFLKNRPRPMRPGRGEGRFRERGPR
jgi:Spy/CpxP family protein refolding chaperone